MERLIDNKYIIPAQVDRRVSQVDHCGRSTGPAGRPAGLRCCWAGARSAAACRSSLIVDWRVSMRCAILRFSAAISSMRWRSFSRDAFTLASRRTNRPREFIIFCSFFKTSHKRYLTTTVSVMIRAADSMFYPLTSCALRIVFMIMISRL